MKKLTVFICSCLAFLLFNQSVSFAYSDNGSINMSSKGKDSFKHNAITDENLINELKSLDPGFSQTTADTGLITPMAFPSDNSGSRTITGKVRQAYTNNDVKIVVSALYNYLASKVPEAAKKNVVYYAINSFVTTKVIGNIKPHYFEAWLWETHDWNRGVHIVYTTIVHYTDSSYTKMDGVDYYQVDYYPIYKNGQHYHKY